MVQLQLYKTLWGHQGSFEQACQQAVEGGFHGIEGQVPEDANEQKRWAELLNEYDLLFIAEITTAGSYVPDRTASLEQHLDCLHKKIKTSLELQPEFITCLGGCDAWEEEQSIAFFEQSMMLAENYQLAISFETHRGRSFFNPWITEKICRVLPEIKLTCDFSHWCVVCERLFDEELEQLEFVFNQAYHVHARVGFDQGAQVSDPSAPMYEKAMQQHQQWWKKIWANKLSKGEEIITMTPEFGPDGYQAINPKTNQAIGDLWKMNCWMAKQQQRNFDVFLMEQLT